MCRDASFMIFHEPLVLLHVNVHATTADMYSREKCE